MTREEPSRLGPVATASAAGLLLLACIAGVAFGPVSLPAGGVVTELLDRLPFVGIDSGLSEREAAILWDLRLPRVVLGGLVGAMLALAGGAYQGVFRNPLADPYLLGVAAGAGFGATLVIASGGGTGLLLAGAAFLGSVVAVAISYAVGRTAGRSAATLILAGVAVASFFTAAQTYVQQRSSDVVREVFSWILGRLATTGWAEVRLVVPFVLAAALVLLGHRRHLDVLAVGEEEAATLGMPIVRVRLLVIGAATLGTAAVVAVSGLIGFVGIVVPHAIRLLTGSSYRVILPLSLLAGAAFLVFSDLLARTIVSPAELPIGVITAFVGAPFFALVLRNAARTA